MPTESMDVIQNLRFTFEEEQSSVQMRCGGIDAHHSVAEPLFVQQLYWGFGNCFLCLLLHETHKSGKIDHRSAPESPIFLSHNQTLSQENYAYPIFFAIFAILQTPLTALP